MEPTPDQPACKTDIANELHGILDGIACSGGFCCAGSLPDVEPPFVAVSGLGLLSFPLSMERVAALASRCSKAPFGLRDATVFDEGVRKTLQLEPDQLTLEESWSHRLSARIVPLLQEGLGLGSAVKLRLEMYKLLLYQQGDFFARHRDSVKSRDMFATLTVVLPSDYTGGEMIVRHGYYAGESDESEDGEDDDEERILARRARAMTEAEEHALTKAAAKKTKRAARMKMKAAAKGAQTEASTAAENDDGKGEEEEDQQDDETASSDDINWCPSKKNPRTEKFQKVKIDVAGDARQLHYLAFYADCEHEIRRIESGHRVCLVYNVCFDADNLCCDGEDNVLGVQDSSEAMVAATAAGTEEIAKILRRWKASNGLPLVYPLHHRYALPTVRLASLKGQDRVKCHLLAAAAREAGARVDFGLVEVEDSDGRSNGHSRCVDIDASRDLSGNRLRGVAHLSWRSHYDYDGELEEDEEENGEFVTVPPDRFDLNRHEEWDGDRGCYGNSMSHSSMFYKTVALVVWTADKARRAHLDGIGLLNELAWSPELVGLRECDDLRTLLAQETKTDDLNAIVARAIDLLLKAGHIALGPLHEALEDVLRRNRTYGKNWLLEAGHLPTFIRAFAACGWESFRGAFEEKLDFRHVSVASWRTVVRACPSHWNPWLWKERAAQRFDELRDATVRDMVEFVLLAADIGDDLLMEQVLHRARLDLASAVDGISKALTEGGIGLLSFPAMSSAFWEIVDHLEKELQFAAAGAGTPPEYFVHCRAPCAFCEFVTDFFTSGESKRVAQHRIRGCGRAPRFGTVTFQRGICTISRIPLASALDKARVEAPRLLHLLSVVPRWSPEHHATMPFVPRCRVAVLLTLARARVFYCEHWRYPQAHLCRLPLELLFYVVQFALGGSPE